MRLDELRDKLDEAADDDLIVRPEAAVMVLRDGETMFIDRVEHDMDGVRIYLEE